ncbi:MAG: hypothetical protein NUW01_14070 [Gemmatimonadaceae bacterium]|nr:hypothetical protein [Gemmatimonadaceae bacterium]
MSLSRVKTWIYEKLTYADLNAEFDNILNNAISLMSGASGSIDASGWIFSQQPKDLLNGICEGRLTLTTATPVTTADVTAATTLYFTPYRGNRISIYDGSNWRIYAFTEVSIAVPATTSTTYDVWGYISGGALALELLAWTNDTTRATAIALQNGVYVKSGTTTRRYLGSFRTTGSSGQTEDSLAKRYVWNYQNRVQRVMKVVEATNSWTYTTATFRQANAGAGNQIDYVQGVSEDPVYAKVIALAANGAGSGGIDVAVGVGVDSTSVNSALLTSGVDIAGVLTNLRVAMPTCEYYGFPGVGRHYLAWLEYSEATDTTIWYGDNNAPTVSQSGIVGVLMG